ncbi:unnamed protein product [Echinostoma caproni]|uniref:non-specific serine/threonine protein kinase n=1 Tax=Echinostoma caproni TaxID=27848 RepID=A0A183AH02_9TREM|nr:unnamed protein product [Echinostoma caproni]
MLPRSRQVNFLGESTTGALGSPNPDPQGSGAVCENCNPLGAGVQFIGSYALRRSKLFNTPRCPIESVTTATTRKFDLKCGNLLVKDDGIIQIADFGVAGFLATQPLTATGSVDLRRFTFVGTPCWMAPEVMQQARGYNQKADIWSLGITTIEMATGQAPYAKYAPMKVLMLTLQNDPPNIDTVATVSNQYINYGQKFRKFTRACLLKDPGQRLSARELLGHTYIKAKAKDRELLCRVLLGGEIPPPATRMSKHADDRAERRDPKPAGPSYRITLRKRNLKQNNELQDISFNYVPGKDSADVLARELVEADLLDGCDLLLVAHNMSELISNPAARERVFPLNSPPAPGQVPVESELHGYAKVLIRLVGSPVP